MHKFLLLYLLLLSTVTCLYSQSRTEDFEIGSPELKISNSLYTAIQYVDSRYDTSSMGIVQLGAFNRKARVVPKIPFSTQLTNTLHALTDSSAKEGKLLFQFRQFNFAEITGAVSEKGYCYIRADLYANKNGRYQKLNSIDTVLLIKSMDVTRALLRNGSKLISNFIAGNLLKEPADSNVYSFNDIQHMDSIEKLKIVAYNTTVYADGLYTSYASFMNLVPDKQVTVEEKKGKISSVKMADGNGAMVKIKRKDIYAIVYKGQPFIATEYDYYPLEKRDDDFYFTGKAKVTADQGAVMAASFFFGIIGGLIASDAEATFEMKIEHSNGGFIRLREIKTVAEN